MRIPARRIGWVPVSYDDPGDRWHREAMEVGLQDGTYELLGPKIQGNKDDRKTHQLQRHAEAQTFEVARSFEAIRDWLSGADVEGLVWHHPDGRMAKIKRRDFGFKW